MNTPVGNATSASPSTDVATAATSALPARVPGRSCGSRPRYQPSQVIDALVAASGVKALAGRALGCSGGTVGNYVKAFPEVRAAFERIHSQAQPYN